MIRKNKTSDHVEKLYNSFVTKDLTLKEFRQRYLAATSPRKLQRDLTKIVEHRQLRQTQKLVAQQQKRKIDTAVAEG